MHRQKIFQSDSFSLSEFPQQQIIESIRVAVLNDSSNSLSDSSLYVSSVYSNKGQFALELSSAARYLLTFVYTGSLWLPSRSNDAFGFLKLRHTPDRYFKYLNKHWKLSKNCYTKPIVRKGLQSLYVEGIKLPQEDILQLRTGGQMQTAYTIASDSVVLNIGRSEQQTDGYYQTPQNTEYYITSVNGYSVSKLTIASSDSTIVIDGPLPVSDDVYVLYVKSLKGFPICPDWSSDSIYI